jgi:hypothetical protein
MCTRRMDGFALRARACTLGLTLSMGLDFVHVLVAIVPHSGTCHIHYLGLVGADSNLRRHLTRAALLARARRRLGDSFSIRA